MRNTSARASPMRRAVSERRGSRRSTRIEMKTTLSTPSTISSAVRLASAAQALKSVNSSSTDRSWFSPEQSGAHDINADRAQDDRDPVRRHEVAHERADRQHRPQDEHRDVERAIPSHPQG